MAYNMLSSLVKEEFVAQECNLTDDELDIMHDEHLEAVAKFEQACAAQDALIDRFTETFNLAATANALHQNGVEASGAAFHFAGVATMNATLDLDLEDDVQCFGEDAGEKLDLVLAGEGFQKVLSNIWKGIKKVRAKIWKFLKKIFAKAVGKTHSTARKIAALRKKAEDSVGKTSPEATVEMTSGVSMFYVATKAEKKWAEIKKVYSNTNALTNYMYSLYLKDMKGYADEYAKAIGSIEAANASAGVASLANITSRFYEKTSTGIKKAGVKLPITTIDAPSRVAGTQDVTIDACELMGNKLFVHYQPSSVELQADQNVSQVVFQSKCNMGVYDFKHKMVKAANELKMDTMAISDITDFCSLAEPTLESMKEVIEKGNIDDLRAKADKMLKDVDKFIKDAMKLEEATQETAAVLNAIPQVFRNFDSWITSPTLGMQGNFIASTNAIIALASKSLSTYTK